MSHSIAVGDPAPDFTAQTSNGQPISLRDFHDRSSLVIFFYPKDESPICTLEACRFRDEYEAFVEAGAAVIGVSGDDTASHHTFANAHRLPFPLISDVGGVLRHAFGVPKSLGILPGRVTYVIDPQGIVRLVFNSQLQGEQHVDKALAMVRNLQTRSDGDSSS